MTTRNQSLKNVQTIIYSKDQNSIINDASNKKGTFGTINSQSFSIGPLSSGQKSETIIIGLSVPFAKNIDNIKIALVDIGDLTFNNTMFGIESKNFLNYNIVPKNFFQGINIDNDPNNIYNINVGNNNNFLSNYVYLNVNMPINQELGIGIIKLKWYFDYV